MEEINKRYYKMADIVEEVGEPASKIRYWDDQFSVINHRGKKNEYRMATQDELIKFIKIKKLSQFLNGNGIKEYFNGNLEISINPELL
ncbi:MAG: MerR family transcriptional regulator [Fulvivirga sp.]|nr:MerR family transcriptional regulator [Fulvivirga sp.]